MDLRAFERTNLFATVDTFLSQLIFIPLVSGCSRAENNFFPCTIPDKRLYWYDRQRESVSINVDFNLLVY